MKILSALFFFLFTLSASAQTGPGPTPNVWYVCGSGLCLNGVNLSGLLVTNGSSPSTSIAPGSGVATALAVNVGSAGAFITNGGAMGTPSSGTLTHATGLPIAGLTGLGTGVGSAMADAINGTGGFVTYSGALGTPSSGTLTHATGLPINGVTGWGTGVATALSNAVNTAGGFVTSLSNITYGTYSLLVNTISGTPSLSSVLSGITSGELTLQSTTNLTSSVICPAGVTLHMLPGAMITQTASYTLAMNCNLVAPTAQIFSGFAARQITFASGSVPAIHGEWWGASPSASASVNTTAANVAYGSCIGGPELDFNAGRFVFAGTGSPSGANGAAIEINSSTNPSNQFCHIHGQGKGATIFQIANSNSFNILEAEAGSCCTSFPTQIDGITFDGNYANNTQQVAGDRYQNSIYFQNVQNITGDIECIGATYHGCAMNAVQYPDLILYAHNNADTGVLITAATLTQVSGKYHIRSNNNGQGGNTQPYDCDDYGVYINNATNLYADIQTSGNNAASGSTSGSNCQANAGSPGNSTSPAGLNVTNDYNDEIHLVSQADRESLQFEVNDQNNQIYVTSLSATDNCIYHYSSSSSGIASNTLHINCQNPENHWIQLGVYGGTFANNSIYLDASDIAETATPQAGIVIGTAVSYNMFFNGVVGDLIGRNNISYLVQSTGTETGNVFTNLSCSGANFTSGFSTGLGAGDKAANNWTNCTAFTH